MDENKRRKLVGNLQKAHDRRSLIKDTEKGDFIEDIHLLNSTKEERLKIVENISDTHDCAGGDIIKSHIQEFIVSKALNQKLRREIHTIKPDYEFRIKDYKDIYYIKNDIIKQLEYFTVAEKYRDIGNLFNLKLDDERANLEIELYRVQYITKVVDGIKEEFALYTWVFSRKTKMHEGYYISLNDEEKNSILDIGFRKQVYSNIKRLIDNEGISRSFISKQTGIATSTVNKVYNLGYLFCSDKTYEALWKWLEKYLGDRLEDNIDRHVKNSNDIENIVDNNNYNLN